jgi:hypothetical protein
MNHRVWGLMGVLFSLVTTTTAHGMGVKRAAYLHTYGNQSPLFRTLYVRMPGRWTFSGHGIPTLHQKYKTCKIVLPLEDTVYTYNMPTIYSYERLSVYSSDELVADEKKYLVPLGSGEVSFLWKQQQVVVHLKDALGHAIPANGTYPLIREFPPVCESCH